MTINESALALLFYCFMIAAVAGTILGGILLRAGFRIWNKRPATQRSASYLSEPGLFQSAGIIFFSILLLFFVWLIIDYGGLLMTIPFSIGFLALFLCWSNWYSWKVGLVISTSYITLSLLVVVLFIPLIFMIVVRVIN